MTGCQFLRNSFFIFLRSIVAFKILFFIKGMLTYFGLFGGHLPSAIVEAPK